MSGPADTLGPGALAGLVVLGALAGVFVAVSVDDGSFGTALATQAENKAFTLDLQGERVQVRLEPTGQAPPSARVTVYRPDDTLFASYELDAHASERSFDPDVHGAWVLVVTASLDARLSVGVQGLEDGAAVERATPIPLSERHRPIIEHPGGPLNLFGRITVLARPALVHLAFEGEAIGLDARVRSAHGTVHTIENVTGVASVRDAHTLGSEAIYPEHLGVGPYTVTARAEAFEGRLVVVQHDYDRSAIHERDPPRFHPDGPPTDQGAQLVELQPGQPIEVDTGQTSALLFGVHQGTYARVYVYDAADEIIAVMGVGERDKDPFDWDGAYENATWTNALLTLPRPGTYVLYAPVIHGSTEHATVVLPGAEHAEPPRPLALDRATATIEHAGPSSGPEARELQVQGGLLGVRIDTEDVVTLRRAVTVQGPRGVVFEHVDRTPDPSQGQGTRTQVHEERFTRGAYTVHVDTRAAAGNTQIELLSYAR